MIATVNGSALYEDTLSDLHRKLRLTPEVLAALASQSQDQRPRPAEFFGLHLDEDFQTGCFTEIIRGYKMGVVEPDVMRGQQEPPE